MFSIRNNAQLQFPLQRQQFQQGSADYQPDDLSSSGSQVDLGRFRIGAPNLDDPTGRQRGEEFPNPDRRLNSQFDSASSNDELGQQES